MSNLQTSAETDPATIVASEVRSWFGQARNPPTIEQCETIASELRKFRSADDRKKVPPGIAINAEFGGKFWDWDIDAVAGAARTLLESLPKQAAFWESHNPQTEKTIAALSAITSLQVSLGQAIEFVEWPLGRFTPKNRKADPDLEREWHLGSILVLRKITKALDLSGEVALWENSIYPRVVFKALVRMGYKLSSYSALQKYLYRQQKGRSQTTPSD